MRQCRVCGCTDDLPCLVYDVYHGFDRPCYWFMPDLCSVCAGVDGADLIAIQRGDQWEKSIRPNLEPPGVSRAGN
jgi:hypothetical protein